MLDGRNNTLERQPIQWIPEFAFALAVRTSGEQRVLRCSGQVSIGENMDVLHPGNMRGQITTALDNLEAVLAEAGFSLSDVVRLNHYTTDVDAWLEAAPDALWSRLTASGCQAASTLLGVARLVFPGLLIEIEATAVK
jgi:enamine deaminase RidA (YjgF/YER057c/UK114 family)